MSEPLSVLQDKILSFLPHGVKAFIDGSSRRDLLRKVDTTLLVFNNEVAHVESGRSLVFQNEAEALDPQKLAAACSTLLGEERSRCSILLLLPPSLFVATSQNLPGINRESLVSALRLQAESLLPANAYPVSLAINPKAAELTSTPLALWINNVTMIELFAEFEQQDMFIVAIKPRILGLKLGGAPLLDADETNVTFVDVQQDVIMNWLQTTRMDLQQDEFNKQWQESITDNSGIAAIELDSIDGYLEAVDGDALQDYVFFPPGALSKRKQLEKGRKLAIAASIIAGLLLLSAIPFLIQSLQFRSLAADLELQRELSYEARQDQAVVVNFENELGPINDFPEQRIREALFTLQNVLSPNQLSSMEITKGLIKIQGTSTEPQAILQRLEMDPMFTEVVFSRATNNDRYYIDLRLSTVNFDAYMVRYFPD